jgi:hypothetical protein
MNNKRKDTRPDEYLYWNQLIEHLGSEDKIFNGEVIFPKQLEFHYPNDKKEACNLNCPICAGTLFDKDLGNFELNAIKIIEQLDGRIPQVIMGGAYTEPFGNPYLLTATAMIKKTGSFFGFHTNGTKLKNLEETTGILTELNRISTSKKDYVSISLDAGLSWDWAKTKGSTNNYSFYDVIEATKMMIDIRNKNNKAGHAIRWCYLISPSSGNIENFMSIVALAKSIGVDSLRFSIPFAPYNQSFDKVKKYKEKVEEVKDDTYFNMLKPFLSDKEIAGEPYIFYTGPEFTDIDRFTFEYCAYGYFQITMGADGYYYKCSTVATPTAKHLRLGKVTDKFEDLVEAIKKNQDVNFNCEKNCFSKGLRCNRMSIDICTKVQEIMDEKKKNNVI